MFPHTIHTTQTHVATFPPLPSLPFFHLINNQQFFPGHKHLDYALKVEEYTLNKAANLVLNVDGCIAGEANEGVHRVGV